MFSPDDLLFLVPEQPLTERAAGGFARRIFVLSLAETEHPANRDFLVKILAAAHINLEKDTLFAEIPGQEAVSFLPVRVRKHPEFALVFGLSPAQIGLSVDAPLYQPFAFYGVSWLFAEALSILEPDKNRKAKLWLALQQMFLT